MMGVRDYSRNERIRTWQAYGERVALIFQHSLHASICQTFLTSKRPPPGQAVCQISVPDMILKGYLACPSSLPVYTIFLPQGKSTLSHYHEAFVLWKHLALAISVNPQGHPIRYAIISSMRDGEIEAHRGEIPWPRPNGWKKTKLFGCSALSGSKGRALNSKLECPTETMWASILCLSSHLWEEKQSCL